MFTKLRGRTFSLTPWIRYQGSKLLGTNFLANQNTHFASRNQLLNRKKLNLVSNCFFFSFVWPKSNIKTVHYFLFGFIFVRLLWRKFFLKKSNKNVALNYPTKYLGRAPNDQNCLIQFFIWRFFYETFCNKEKKIDWCLIFTNLLKPYRCSTLLTSKWEFRHQSPGPPVQILCTFLFATHGQQQEPAAGNFA